MANTFLLIFALLTLFCFANGVYVEETGSPYDPGSLTGTVETFLFSPQTHGIPMQIRAYYPAVEEELAVIMWQPGLGGIVPPLIYSDIAGQVASHGFLTLLPMAFNGGVQILESLEWLEENMGDYINGTTAAFDTIGFFCHSSGCQDVMELLESHPDPNFARAVYMQEPFMLQTDDITLPIPAVFYGTNASCNNPGLDYLAAYDAWTDSKLRTGNSNYGHCDILDEYMITLCRFVCPGGAADDQLAEYRRVVQGEVSALFINMLQGRADVIDYIVDPDMIPLTPTDHDASLW